MLSGRENDTRTFIESKDIKKKIMDIQRKREKPKNFYDYDIEVLDDDDFDYEVAEDDDYDI